LGRRSEEELRSEAVRRRLAGESPERTAASLGRSRRRVSKWVARHAAGEEGSSAPATSTAGCRSSPSTWSTSPPTRPRSRSRPTSARRPRRGAPARLGAARRPRADPVRQRQALPARLRQPRGDRQGGAAPGGDTGLHPPGRALAKRRLRAVQRHLRQALLPLRALRRPRGARSAGARLRVLPQLKPPLPGDRPADARRGPRESGAAAAAAALRAAGRLARGGPGRVHPLHPLRPQAALAAARGRDGPRPTSTAT
jgi:hypothetical protein